MAIMIPSVTTPKVKSSAERRIFEWFRNAPKTDDWIVLHSLGIANHNKVIFGETDFFVLVPNHGIFALEVKGGRVRRERGIWMFTDKYNFINTKERGPFDQAREGIFNIVKTIKTRLDINHRHLDKVFFGYGAMFPDIEYTSMGVEDEQWQVFDINDGSNVRDYVLRLSLNARKKWESVYSPLESSRLPSLSDIKYLAQLLRGDFDMAVSLDTQIRYADEALIELTKEQYRCLDQIDDNPRCIILGAAGTGKTLLALEEAKKSTASGDRVAFFCFNTNLGDWLKEYFKEFPIDLQPAYVGTFHRYMLSVTKEIETQETVPSNSHEQEYFFSDTLPQNALTALDCVSDKYDKIIIDEAQDLISSRYLDVIDASLLKGLDRGHWIMFGDFTRQAIYSNGQSGDDLLNQIDSRGIGARFKLNINCRNTKSICNEMNVISGYDINIRLKYNVDGPPVQYLTYADDNEQIIKLNEVLDKLIENQIEPRKITILSPNRRENSVISKITGYSIQDYKKGVNDKITFCTIQAYKGLENTVIILVDIDNFQSEKLMYVGLSRARSGLYILCSTKARKEYTHLSIRRYIS